MKIIKKILLWSALFFAVLLLLLFIVNAFDEDLSPEISTLATVPGAAVAQQENGYFNFYGFAAPAGQDAHQRGVELVREYEQTTAGDQKRTIASGEDRNREDNSIGFVGDRSKLCGRSSTSDQCLAFYARHGGDTSRLLADNMLLLERYDRLIRYRHFQLTVKPYPTIPIPSFDLVRTAHQLWLAKISRLLEQGERAAVLAALQQEASFSRRMAEESSSMIDKLIAFMILSDDLRALSGIISMHNLMPAEKVAAEAILRPLTEPEMSFGRVFRYEFEMNRNFLTSAVKGGHLYALFESESTYEAASFLSKAKWFFIRPLLNVNATLNLLHRRYVNTLEFDALSAKVFAARMKAGNVNRNGTALRWNMIYNPAGKVYDAVLTPDYSEYTGRGHKLDGLMLLVSLQLLLKEKTVPKNSIVQFIKNSGPRYADPYTDDPMRWNEKNNSIYFEASDGSGGLTDRVEIEL